MSSISASEPIAASLPVAFTKLITACTFGPIEPGANSALNASRAAGLALAILRSPSLEVYTSGIHIGGDNK